MRGSEQRGRVNAPGTAHSHQCATGAFSGDAEPSLRFCRADFHRLIRALAASLAFYALFPWLDLLSKPLAEAIMLGLWSVPGLFFLAALHSSPLLQQLPERFSFLRVPLIAGISFACSLLSLFFVMGIIVAINSLLGIPLKAT